MSLTSLVIDHMISSIKKIAPKNNQEWDQLTGKIRESWNKKRKKSRFERVMTFGLLIACTISLLIGVIHKVHAMTPTPIVHDPTTNANLSLQIATTKDVLQASNDQRQIMKDMQEQLTKINSFLSDLRYLERATERQAYIATQTKVVYERMRQSETFNASELALILANLTYITTESLENMRMIQLILSPGKMKMTDGERLFQIRELDKEMRYLSRKMMMLEQKYERYAITRKTKELYLKRRIRE